MFNNFLNKTIFQNRILDYLIFIVIFLLSFFILLLIKRIVLAKLKIYTKKTVSTLDDFFIELFEKFVFPLFYFGSFYICLQKLNIPQKINKFINIIGIFILTFFAIQIIISILNYIINIYGLKNSKDEQNKRSMSGIQIILKIIIWVLGSVFLLDNLGFKISAVITGLGIGGVAVALASQALLADLFSFFAILFDKPFEIGDFIIIGDFQGEVEHIGVKTTRLRSLGGEQLIFSNTDLTNSRVRNYKRMQKRRILFKIGVTYQTKFEQIKEIPKIIEDIIKNINNTIFDRAHFFSYGDFNLSYEIVYYVLSSDYNIYMDIQQKVNFAIMEEFNKRGIEFAYPTQTIYLSK